MDFDLLKRFGFLCIFFLTTILPTKRSTSTHDATLYLSIYYLETFFIWFCFTEWMKKWGELGDGGCFLHFTPPLVSPTDLFFPLFFPSTICSVSSVIPMARPTATCSQEMEWKHKKDFVQNFECMQVGSFMNWTHFTRLGKVAVKREIHNTTKDLIQNQEIPTFVRKQSASLSYS